MLGMSGDFFTGSYRLGQIESEVDGLCQTFRLNPLVPRVQETKIRNLTLNRILFIEFVKKMVYLGAHYSERQGFMG